MNTNYVASHNDYKIWLKQKIWVDSHIKSYRYEYIPNFTNEITKWMKKLGYTMNGMWGAKAVSKWLYAIQVVEVAERNSYKALNYPEIRHRNTSEDRDRFEIIVSFDEINNFMNNWILIEDLDINTKKGGRVRDEMSEFLYCYLDLESSKHGIAITRYLEDGEEDEEEYLQTAKPKNKDQYLLDAEEGWHK